jgi:hypothetical protein
MGALNIGGRLALSLSCLAVAAVSLPLAAQGATPKSVRPSTGGALHVLGTSALLTATVDPNGKATSFYFQYGPTVTYGSQTAATSVGSGIVKVKVGQTVSGLLRGVVYHYRVVASSQGVLTAGRDRVFATGSTKLKFVITKPAADVFGSPAVLSGSLTGIGSGAHRIALQASPFPYLEPFTNIGIPGITDGSGRFSFRIANLLMSTEFRVVTLDLLPLLSHPVTVGVAVRVSFSVRSSGQPGLVRLYGKVTPAIPAGAQVLFQVQKAVRPGKNEATTRYVSQFTTKTKRATKSFSRFSAVVKIRKGGRYRAYIKLKGGPYVSGTSSRTIVLHAAPSSGKRKK